MAKCSFYVQIEPVFRKAYNGDRLRVDKLVARRVTTRYPKDPLAGVVVAKLNLEIPDAALLPLEPEADVTFAADNLHIIVRADALPTVE